MSLQYEYLRVESRDSVARLTLDTAGRQNPLDDAVRSELLQALLSLQDDDAVRVVVITGAGKTFSCGVPPEELATLREDRAGYERMRPLLDEGRRIVERMQEFPKPTVAVLNGPARGAGAALALACDLRISCESASLAFDFCRAGMAPEWGTSFMLPRLLGPARALELLWTGRRVDSAEAEELGLVHRVVPSAHLNEEIHRLCRRLISVPTETLRLTRMAVQTSLDCDLAAMLDLESEIQFRCWDAPGAAEAAARWAERQRKRRVHEGGVG